MRSRTQTCKSIGAAILGQPYVAKRKSELPPVVLNALKGKKK